MERRMWCVGLALALALDLTAPAAHAADRSQLVRLLDGARPTGPASPEAMLTPPETDRPAQVDYGPGPGLPRPGATWQGRTTMVASAAAGVPAGGSTAGSIGLFGAPVSWPIIAIHTVLLPDGRVMSYGTDSKGRQGAQLIYDVWTPSAGTGTSAHLVLPNTTATDLFCSGQSMMWGSGQTLITGGDLTINGKRNFSNNHTTIFDPASNTIAAGAMMQYPRWYDSIVPLPNGQMLVLGGRSDPTTSVLTPELFDPASGWTTLTGATSSTVFSNFYYPRGYVAPGGDVFILASSGKLFSLDPTGLGSTSQYPGLAPSGSNQLPTVMYAPGQLLSVRSTTAVVVNLNGSKPKVTTTGSLSQLRYWSSGTVLPDGRVVVTGGSMVANEMTGVAYSAEIWDPATGVWTLAAAATKPRMYHSNALLLPDATVLTAGGGAPGPVINLNAEIYYPSYLYLPSGQPATRPSLLSAPGDVAVGQSLTAGVGAGNQIDRVTFVRTGSSTHSNNMEQRFLDLPFTQSGASITATLPGNASVVLPGYWMLFVWQRGVPSVALIVRVPS